MGTATTSPAASPAKFKAEGPRKQNLEVAGLLSPLRSSQRDRVGKNVGRRVAR